MVRSPTLDEAIATLYAIAADAGPWDRALAALAAASGEPSLSVQRISRRDGRRRVVAHAGAGATIADDAAGGVAACLALGHSAREATIDEGADEVIVFRASGTDVSRHWPALVLHITRAWAIRRSGQRREAIGVGLSGLFDRAIHPTLIIDGQATLLKANEAARQWLDAQRIALLRDGVVVMTAETDARWLHTLLTDVPAETAATPSPTRRVRLLAGEPATLMTSLSSRTGDAVSHVLQWVPCAPVAPASPSLLSRAFALTPAEARVAAALAQGQTPKQIATTHGVAMATVRAQLRSIYDKTTTRGQSDLMRLMAGLTL